MSARNYKSARDKNNSNCLPNINQQKFGYRTGQELPPVSANTGNLLNRNIGLSYNIQSYIASSNERAGTPFSDFFSESETSGTPDFRSEESDSSAGSVLRRNTAEATRTLAKEWEQIERTLYDEPGDKSTRPQIIEECKQWRQLHPQLRIIGKAIQLPEKKFSCRQHEYYDEIIAQHYSDYEQFSDNEELHSQSSTDVTPQNSPRVSVCEMAVEQKVSWENIPIHEEPHEPKLGREKVSFFQKHIEEPELPDTFCSLLHITPIQIRSPSQRKRPNPSIIRSEIASSRWMRNSRPDSSINCDRNSAKSFVSLDTRNYGNLALSASEHNKMLNSRVLTARHRDLQRLEPLYTPELPQHDITRVSNSMGHQYNIRKVSLPPLLLEEEKRKVPLSSAKKHMKTRRSVPKSYNLERTRFNH